MSEPTEHPMTRDTVSDTTQHWPPLTGVGSCRAWWLNRDGGTGAFPAAPRRHQKRYRAVSERFKYAAYRAVPKGLLYRYEGSGFRVSAERVKKTAAEMPQKGPRCSHVS